MRARAILLPVILVAATTAVQALLIARYGAGTTYLIFVVPVIVSALLGGWTSGIVANVLGLAAAAAMPAAPIFNQIAGSLTIPLRLILMFAIGLAMSVIIERLRANQRELRRRTAELEQITDAMPVYVVRCSADHTFLFVNHSYAHRFGLTAADVIGRKIPDVLGADGYATIRPYIERALSGEHVRYETEVTYPGLGVRLMRCEYVPEPAADGTIRSYVGVIVDVTDQRRAEAAAEADRVRAQLAIEAAGLATWEWNVGRGELSWSSRACELFGVAPDTRMTAELVLAAVHPADRDRLRDIVARHATAPEAGRLLETEFRIVRVGDSEERWIRATGRLEAAEGRVSRAIGTLQDVTAQHEAKHALEQALAREHEARKQAERASGLKDEFLATLSHELRTPLNAILGYTRMLRTGVVPQARFDQALDVVERNARLQRQLVDDILDVSRIITGKLRLTVQLIEPAAVVDLALESLRPAAEAKRLRLGLNVRGSVARVLADPDRLQQIVWNLVSNAVKFTPEGGKVSVEIAADHMAGHLLIKVSDTGQGISPAFLPHVFERFRQGNTNTAREHGGLGLGLAIVRHLVELQGGTIEAESAGEGRGATFTVRLPLAVRTANLDDSHGTHVFREETLPRDARLDGIRVLVVDDEADVLAMLAYMLESCGAIVTAATTASNGLREMERQIPDVIVSDIAMPGMDGHEFMRVIRERPASEGGRVPAIALSAHARPQDRDAALSAGYQVHIGKPCQPADLTSAIAGLVGAAR